MANSIYFEFFGNCCWEAKTSVLIYCVLESLNLIFSPFLSSPLHQPCPGFGISPSPPPPLGPPFACAPAPACQDDPNFFSFGTLPCGTTDPNICVTDVVNAEEACQVSVQDLYSYIYIYVCVCVYVCVFEIDSPSDDGDEISKRYREQLQRLEMSNVIKIQSLLHL